MNDGVFDLRLTNIMAHQPQRSRSKRAAGVTLQSTGRLVASTYGSNVIALNDNTLDVRQGEMALVCQRRIFNDRRVNAVWWRLSGGAWRDPA